MIKLLTKVAVLTGVLFNVGFMLYAGEPNSLAWWAFALPLGAWVFSPYVVLFIASTRRGSTGYDLAVLLMTCGVTLLGVWALYSGFIVNPDPQSGLLFLFVPLWQLLATGVLLFITRLVVSRV